MLNVETKVFYKEQEWQPPPDLELLDADLENKSEEGQVAAEASDAAQVDAAAEVEVTPRGPSFSTLFVFWLLGIVVWCMIYKDGMSSSKRSRRKVPKGSTKRQRNKRNGERSVAGTSSSQEVGDDNDDYDEPAKDV